MSVAGKTLREPILALVKRRYGGSRDRAAEAWGISRSQLDRTIQGVCNPPRQVAKALGLVLAYVPQESLAQQPVAVLYRPARKAVGHPLR